MPDHHVRDISRFQRYPGSRWRLRGRYKPPLSLSLSLFGEGVSGRGEDSRKSSWTTGLGRVRMKGVRAKRGSEGRQFTGLAA